MAEADAHRPKETAPSLKTLQAHRGLLHTPQHVLAWLPLYVRSTVAKTRRCQAAARSSG